MAEITDLKAKIKRYYKFSPAELRGIIISILVIAFIISFDEWGYGANINISVGLLNLGNAILITALTLLVRHSAQRIGALQIGFTAEYRMWTWGLLLGLVLAFVSNGNIWLLMPAGIVCHHLAGHRLGWFRYGINYYAVGIVALWGPLANVLLVIFFKIISTMIYNPLIEKAILLNIGMAIWTMLPIPPMDGSRVFFGSRLTYIFSLAFIIFACLLLYAKISIFVSIAGAFILGLIAWLLYYIYLERRLWGGPGGGKIVP